MPAKLHSRFCAASAFGGLVVSFTTTAWATAESICPAPRATCVLPAATRLTEQTPGYFHAAQKDIGGEITDSGCAEPLPTCVRPQAQVAQLLHQEWVTKPHSSSTVAELLDAWSEASNGRPTLTTIEKNWLARRHQTWLSGVALEAVVRLTSSVTADDLARDFTWTIDTSRGNGPLLHGVPNDEAQRLFCPQLRVELDPITHAATAIDLADRAGVWRPIDLPWAVFPEELRGITTINWEGSLLEVATSATDLPPSPTNVAAPQVAVEPVEIDIQIRR